MELPQLLAGFQNNSPYGLGSSTSSLPELADPLQQSMSLPNRSSQHSVAASVNSDLPLVQSAEVKRLQLPDQTDHPLRLSKSLHLSGDKHSNSSSLGSETVGDMAANRFDPLLNGGISRKKGSIGNTLGTARKIKLTNQWQTATDSVGSSDRFDFYRFDLEVGRSFHLKLAGQQNSVDSLLLNASGQVVKDLSGPFGKKQVALHTALNAGTYYLKVAGHDNDTSYRLSLSDDPGGARRSAQPISGNQQTLIDSIGSTDRSDMYRFVVDKKSTVQCNLKGLKANADLALINSQGQVLQTSQHFGKKDESIAATLEQGTYYLKVTGWGKETKYRLNVSAQEVPVLPIPKPSVPGTGIFTVGDTGQVSIDYLFDGSSLQGELAIFNLKGMEQYGVGSKRYMQEAMIRALGNSPDSGYVAILDQTEGAKFSSSPGEPNFNAGEYRGAKTFTMNPGDKFGIMLVPNGTTPDALFNSNLTGDQRPLFSMPEANPESAVQLAQVVDVVADGNSFTFEDTGLTNDSDRNYGDVIFQLRGATGSAASLNDVTTGAKDWRNSSLGQQIVTYAATNKYGPLPNIGADLSSVFVEYEIYLHNGGNPSAFTPKNSLLQVQNGQVVIDAVASGSTDGLLADLQALGLQQATSLGSFVSGLLPIEALNDLAQLNSVKFARPAYQPFLHSGQADSQGDKAISADKARTGFGVDGTGVTVGVLSDSYNTLPDKVTNPETGKTIDLINAADDVASGDLPANVFVPSGWDAAVGTDEGRAMLQIIHDVAPGAGLAFHTVGNSEVDSAQGIIKSEVNFAQNIVKLATDSKANVLVDDVMFLTEPMFQDGIIAQAVDQVVTNGVSYFSAAGNSGSASYESSFRRSGQFESISSGGEFHDFDPGLGVDPFQSITIPVGTKLTIAFQWDSPFFSISGGAGSSTDLDIFLFDSTGTKALAEGIDRNVGEDAVESFAFVNDGSYGTDQFNLAISNFAGSNAGLMKYVMFAKGGNVTINEFNTSSSTIYGHANAAGAEAVGAADYRKTPIFGTNPATLENFSSVGSTPILFNTVGDRLSTPDIRKKPGVVAPDGTDTTFFPLSKDIKDMDTDGDGFPNFFGTSAAAPHAAAVAALMLEAVPGANPTNIYKALENTALDMDNPNTPGFDTGFDNATGYGLVQADQAVEEIQKLEIPTVSIHATDPIASEDGDPGQFVVTRTGGSIISDLVVDYLYSGTATNISDYLVSGSVTIPAGSTSAAIPIIPIDDDVYEGDETVNIIIPPKLSYNVSDSDQNTVTIKDSESLITLNADGPVTAENRGNGTFTLTRTGGSTKDDLVVNFTTGGTASYGSDYSLYPFPASDPSHPLDSDSVVIPSGNSRVIVLVRPKDDSVYEGDETVDLALVPSSTYGVGSPDRGTVTIKDNEIKPTVTISAVGSYLTEVQDKSTQFIVSREGGSLNEDLIVNYTIGGNATYGEDYFLSSALDNSSNPIHGSVTIPAGSNTASIFMTPYEDDLPEGTETMEVNLSPAPTYNLGDVSRGTASIVDDTLVIDRVLMYETPQHGTWLYSFDARSENSSQPFTFHHPNEEYEGDNKAISMGLKLPNIAPGDLINFHMGLDNDEEAVTNSRASEQSNSGFIADFSGQRTFRPRNDWYYTIYWHMA